MKNWEEILEDLANSGQSVSGYCREHGLRPHTVRYWKQKQARHQSGFIEVKSRTDSPVEIVYPTGVRIRLGSGFKIAEIKALLDV